MADVHRVSLGHDSVLLYLKRGQRSKILSPWAADTLLRGRNFLTLEEHSKALSSLDVEKSTPYHQLLEELVREGFLISKNAFLKACSGQSSSRREDPISILSFLTRNRVKSLERAVNSYIQNNLKFGRDIPILIVDASPEASVQAQYQEMLRLIKKTTGRQINYIGENEKSAYAEALVKEKGLPQEVVHFALFDAEGLGFTYGLNRNLLLLETTGKKMAMFDDDTVCRLTEAPGRGQALSVLSAVDPTEFCFYSNFSAIEETVPFIEEDILKIHEQLLGKDLCECIHASGSRVNIDQMNASFMEKIMGGGGHVLATMTGVVGDSGMGSVPSYYLTLSGDSRQRLLQTEEGYRVYLKNRQVLRKVSFPTITDGPFWMTTSCSMDNRDLLPPFLPVLRNEDGLFGLMLRKCIPNGYFGYLPWALLHHPIEEPRSSSDDFALKALYVNCVDILIYLVSGFEFVSADVNVVERLKALGEYLMELGSLPIEDFEMIFLEKVWKAKSEYLQRLESILKFYRESPNFWAEDVKKYLHSIRESLGRKDFSVPRTLKKDLEDDDLKKLNQKMVLCFGKLLVYWPEMVQAARELHQDGRSISRSL